MQPLLAFYSLISLQKDEHDPYGRQILGSALVPVERANFAFFNRRQIGILIWNFCAFFFGPSLPQ